MTVARVPALEELIHRLDEAVAVRDDAACCRRVKQVLTDVIGRGEAEPVQLVRRLRHLFSEGSRHGLNGLLLRLLPQVLVSPEHAVDGLQKGGLQVGREHEVLFDPNLELASSLWWCLRQSLYDLGTHMSAPRVYKGHAVGRTDTHGDFL